MRVFPWLHRLGTAIVIELVRRTRPVHRQHVERIVVVVDPKPDLFEMAFARRATGSFACGVDGWHREGDPNARDD